MSSLVRGTVPITLVIGRPWTHKLVWTNPDGTPVDLTGMAIEASLRTDGLVGTHPSWTPTVQRDDPGGTIVLTLGASDTAGVPDGTLSASHVTVTAADGQTLDIVERIAGVRP